MRILPVPTLKQKTHLDCGVTALRMVLKYFGRTISSAAVLKRIGGLKRYGVRAIALAEAAESLGFATTIFSYNKEFAQKKAMIKKPSKKFLFDFLRQRIPVIITARTYLLYGYSRASRTGHFIVLTGYDGKRFYYNDPYDGKKHSIERKKLLRAWKDHARDSSAYLLALHLKREC